MNDEDSIVEYKENEIKTDVTLIDDLNLFNNINNEDYIFSDYVEKQEPKKTIKTKSKCFLFYCVLSFSVAIFTLSFAATEILYAFVGDKYPSDLLISRLFGEGEAEMNFAELMLNQSFMPLHAPVQVTEEETTGTGESTTTPDTTTAPQTTAPSDTTAPPIIDKPIVNIYDYDYTKVPSGQIPIVPMDLSLYSNGNDFLYNDTGYNPSISNLLETPFIFPNSTYPTNYPLVLIVHTHTSEAYSADGAISYKDDGGELARSSDTAKNVIAVGDVMAEILNQNGIKTLHCYVIHDESYKDSYSRSAETIKRYLKDYPTIRLVIDLHRDSIMNSKGDLIRPVILENGQTVAQVMAVIGSNYSGQSHPCWQDNLQLALQLRQKLNDKYTNICRPVSLRSTTYNQELSPLSILLEIGASGNSLEEAQRAARLVGLSLCELMLPAG